jgi:hypothetical protein
LTKVLVGFCKIEENPDWVVVQTIFQVVAFLHGPKFRASPPVLVASLVLGDPSNPVPNLFEGTGHNLVPVPFYFKYGTWVLVLVFKLTKLI